MTTYFCLLPATASACGRLGRASARPLVKWDSATSGARAHQESPARLLRWVQHCLWLSQTLQVQYLWPNSTAFCIISKMSSSASVSLNLSPAAPPRLSCRNRHSLCRPNLSARTLRCAPPSVLARHDLCVNDPPCLSRHTFRSGCRHPDGHTVMDALSMLLSEPSMMYSS